MMHDAANMISLSNAAFALPNPTRTLPDVFGADTLCTLTGPAPAALLDPIILPGGLALIRGEGGVGKSWLALSIAQAVAAGGDLMGWRAAAPAAVFYVDGGLSLRHLALRADALGCRYKPLRFAAASNQPLPDLGTKDGLAALTAMIPEGTRLLVLDSLPTLVACGRGQTQRIHALAAWIEARRRDGLAVLLVDGPRRAATSLLDARADVVLALRQPDVYAEGEGARMLVRYAVTRGLAGRAVWPFEARLTLAQGRATWQRIAEVDHMALSAWRLNEREDMTVREVAQRMQISTASAWRLLKRADGLDPAVREGYLAQSAAETPCTTPETKPWPEPAPAPAPAFCTIPGTSPGLDTASEATAMCTTPGTAGT